MSRFSPPAPSSSSVKSSGIALQPPSSPSSTSMRSRSRTQTGGSGTGGAAGLKVSTSELGVPPSFMRSKSTSAMTGDALSRVSSNTSNSGDRGAPPIAGSGGKRGRSSSILSMHEIKENYDDDLDQGALTNLNADWVNYKGKELFFKYQLPCSHLLQEHGSSTSS